MWNIDHLGASISSTHITGTERQGSCPNRVNAKRVNTLAFSAPPWARIASRAWRMCGASTSSPISFNAR